MMVCMDSADTLSQLKNSGAVKTVQYLHHGIATSRWMWAACLMNSELRQECRIFDTQLQYPTKINKVFYIPIEEVAEREYCLFFNNTSHVSNACVSFKRDHAKKTTTKENRKKKNISKIQSSVDPDKHQNKDQLRACALGS